MTEKDVQIALGTYLPEVWKESCKLCAEGLKLYDEGLKLWDEGLKLWDESDKLQAESWKLFTKGKKLYAEGRKLFTDAVIEVYGSDIIEWKKYGCSVDGREFRE